MTAPWGPDEAESAEILEAARRGAISAGATGAIIDDVCQNVAERLTEKWREPHIVAARHRAPPDWHAYIRVMARNALRDLLRKETRRTKREGRAIRSTDGEPLPDRPGRQPHSHHEISDLDRYLARLLILDLIDECLDGRSRDIAALHYIDGLSTNEIAARLDLSVRTVNAHKRRAKEQLRAALRGTPPAPPASAERTGTTSTHRNLPIGRTRLRPACPAELRRAGPGGRYGALPLPHCGQRQFLQLRQ